MHECVKEKVENLLRKQIGMGIIIRKHKSKEDNNGIHDIFVKRLSFH